MTHDEHPRHSKPSRRRRIWLALLLLCAVAAALIVPPLISVSRYKSQITQLVAQSLGRPVRLASVEVRLLPRPGFVLSDLTVAEDPGFGAEPLLHADSVTASLRFFPLWVGRLEIGSISVDDASMNLVRDAGGRWNLAPLFRTAAAKTGQAGQNRPIPLPSIEATNSRINFKNGAEKLPFSLTDADLSFWQSSPGEWRVRLRGQPVRTDMSLDSADTGIVRLEASLRSAPALRQMPIRLDMDWKQAQLGQLARLILGADTGWRGDLTGQVHLEGTPDSAQVQARLRATSVHRAEFAPAEPLDFDANCNFVLHYPAHAIEKLACNSPLGDGHIRLTGQKPGTGGSQLTLALDQIPVAASLDLLRIMRSGFAPGLQANGRVSGTLVYAAPASAPPAPSHLRHPAPPGADHALTGSLTVQGFQLSGGALSQPLSVAKIILEPVSGAGNQMPAIAAAVDIPAGAPTPLTLDLRLGLRGYQASLHGQASLARARELAHAAGLVQSTPLDAFAGDPLAVDLTAAGPWMLAHDASLASPAEGGPAAISAAAPVVLLPTTDTFSGTVTLQNVNWKADFLANPVLISQATLHLGEGQLRWNPIDFAYGPIKGAASLTVPLSCADPQNQPCPPQFAVHLGDLDAAQLQASILGAREPATLLSTLIARFHLSSPPAWPRLEGTVEADSLKLGPVALVKPAVSLRTVADGAEIRSLDAGLLGGRIHATGAVHAVQSAQDLPAYTLKASLENLQPADLGRLLGMRWSGGPIDAQGSVKLAGFTAGALAASATGTLRFEWKRGGMAAAAASKSAAVPAALTRFDRWTAQADIANGSIALKQNLVLRGASKLAVEGQVTLGHPPRLVFAPSHPEPAARR